MDHIEEEGGNVISGAQLEEILLSRDEVKRSKKTKPPYHIEEDEIVGR